MGCWIPPGTRTPFLSLATSELSLPVASIWSALRSVPGLPAATTKALPRPELSVHMLHKPTRHALSATTLGKEEGSWGRAGPSRTAESPMLDRPPSARPASPSLNPARPQLRPSPNQGAPDPQMIGHDPYLPPFDHVPITRFTSVISSFAQSPLIFQFTLISLQGRLSISRPCYLESS